MRKHYNHKRLFGCDEVLNKQLADELKGRRLELGLTQEDMAKKMCVRQSTVSGIENATDNITITKLVRYLSALGLDGVVKLQINDGRICILCESFKAGCYIDQFLDLPSALGLNLASLSNHELSKFNNQQLIPDDNLDYNFFPVASGIPCPEIPENVPNWTPLESSMSRQEIGGFSELYLSH